MNPYEHFLLVMVAADELNRKEEKPLRTITAIRDIALMDALLTGAPYTIQDGCMSVLVNGREYRLSVEYFNQLAKKKAKEDITETEFDEPQDIRPYIPSIGLETGEELIRRIFLLEATYNLRDRKLYTPNFPEDAFRFQDEEISKMADTVQAENDNLRTQITELEKERDDARRELKEAQEKLQQLRLEYSAQKRVIASLSVYYGFILQNPGIVPKDKAGSSPEENTEIDDENITEISAPGTSSSAVSGEAVEEPAPSAEDTAAHPGVTAPQTFAPRTDQRTDEGVAEPDSDEGLRIWKDSYEDNAGTGERTPGSVRIKTQYVDPASVNDSFTNEPQPHSITETPAAVSSERAIVLALLPVMPAQGILMSHIKGIVRDEDGNETPFFAFVAPVDESGRTLAWVSWMKRTYTAVSESPNEPATVRADDVTFEAKWRAGAASPVFRLAEVSKSDGYNLKKKGATNNGIGHVYIERDGLCVHVFPVDRKNGNDGLANFFYMIDTGSSVRTGDNAYRRRIEFDHHDERYEVECRWNGNNELTAAFLN